MSVVLEMLQYPFMVRALVVGVLGLPGFVLLLLLQWVL